PPPWDIDHQNNQTYIPLSTLSPSRRTGVAGTVAAGSPAADGGGGGTLGGGAGTPTVTGVDRAASRTLLPRRSDRGPAGLLLAA
ncbi:hypothetical protein THAOC_00590, partial [Thalassiosira oceanica]